MALFEHEVFHVGLKHPRLMREVCQEPDFDNDSWQKACDQPINERLIKKGRKMPGFPFYDPKYDGMSAIRVYRLLLEEKKQVLAQCQMPGMGGSGQDDSQPCGTQPGDTEADGSGTGAPHPDPSSTDKFKSDPAQSGGVMPLMDEKFDLVEMDKLESAERDFKIKIVNASRVIEKTHGIGDPPEFVKEIIEANIGPQRTYKDELMDLMELVTRDDYSWGKRNIKYENIYLPSLYEKKAQELIVGMDTSGSVSDNELKIYGGEISGILQEFDGIEITVIYHSTRVTHVETFGTDDLPIKLTPMVRGGTCYLDTFREIERRGLEPIVMLYFTDLWVGQNNYPRKHPDFPVYWLNTAGKNVRHSNPPFGTVIDLDPTV
jgi:predicted metal-dependent peptidase